MYRLEETFFDQSLYIDDDYRTVQDLDSDYQSQRSNSQAPKRLFYFEVVKKIEGKRPSNSHLTVNELF